MKSHNWKNWIKEIVLVIMLIIECIVTYCGFTNNWDLEVRIALIFASVLTLFNEILSVLNKFDKHVDELRAESKNEHQQIKGAIELYSNIEKLNFVVNFENNFVSTQNKAGVEMWIISNSVAEPPEIIKKIFSNLTNGVKYYYIIPKSNSCLNDIKNTAQQLKEMDKKGILKKENFVYIQDDLFDLMPTDLVDILFYCNPMSTDYETNMTIFYSFQDNNLGDIFYKPADLKEHEIRRYFDKMEKWKDREWESLL